MYVLGIDIGSTASKAVAMTMDKKIYAKAVVSHGTGAIGPKQVYEKILSESKLEKSELKRILVTGYGRFVFDDADSQKSEISCHAKGVLYLSPDVRTIIDIGGQDVKAILLNDKGMITNFVMNDKCAAGTGRFLDNMAKVLNVKTHELGALSEHATEVVNISNTCTVFAESEVISQLSKNVSVENLIAGIHQSVAKRVSSLVYRNGIVKEVALSGGVALNKGVVKALSEALKLEIIVHEDCQFSGALGAALFALEEIGQK
ncbi:acyl-CoA dehydratase activase [Fusibacter ferrireducens]|uniref:2-hydroxyglutaryl-CoA dehydratase n=1 Tax=Fusibacter ferrireducens TaxID=2785058 RepID=A0ABR9ZX66_9FIRM|nr:acyl-CoA dehydratase activase [Fusibacter ferrireducens]MBF4695054.1 2-hydroxyglutaryl-CoA dehydratase [Fusibacter ferrireducens]